MATDATESKLPFPLNAAVRFLDTFKYPTGPHDPRGDWRLSYRVVTLIGRGAATGSLAVQRKAQAERQAVLNVRYERTLPQAGTRVTEAEIHCRGDSLSTPRRWQFTSESVGQDGKAIAHTGLSKSAVANGDHIEITDGPRRSRIAVPGAWTVSWALFDAIGRLPRAAFDPIRFTMLDHFDQVKRNQTLSYRGAAAVLVGQRRVRKQRWVELEKGRIRKTTWDREGGQELRLHAYDHLGDGIVPWVYWVDEQGRLLFVVSGLEGYILDTGP